MEQMEHNNKAIFISLSIILLIAAAIVLFASKNNIIKKINTTLNQNQSQTKTTMQQTQPTINDNSLGFNAKQAPTFNFNSVAFAKDIQSNTTVYNSKGQKIQAEMAVKQTDTGTAIKIINSPQFTPGKYIIVVDENGKKIEQNFTWGVLAINPDKANYIPGENAFLSLAVLDEKGKMVCDADVTLNITDPSGHTTTLTTRNASITVNPECNLKSYTEKPDYQASYKTTTAGNYEMNLTAVTKNGTYSIKDFFTANTITPFDIQRESATRIFPHSAYPVKIKITANQDFSGQIKEAVPSSFKISKLDNYTNFDTTENSGDFTYVIWNVSLKKGQTISLGYKYNAPIISPQFYLIGAMAFYIDPNTMLYRENRFWQIAADAITFVQEVGTGGSLGSGATINIAVTTTIGNYIIVAVNDITTNGSTISDSKGNTYSFDVGCTVQPGETVDIYSTKITSVLSSGDTISAATAGGGAIYISAAEYNGLDPTSRLDKTICASSSVANLAYDSGLTATTTSANELVIGVLARTGLAGTLTPEVLTPPWNTNAQAGTVGSWINPFYRIVSSTGQFSNKGTSNRATVWGSAVATYKMDPANGGGSTNSFQFSGMRLNGVRIN